MTDYSEALLELRHWTKVYADSMRIKQRKAALFAARKIARVGHDLEDATSASAASDAPRRAS